MKGSSPLLRSNNRVNFQDSLTLSRDILIMQRDSRTVDSGLSFYSIEKDLTEAPEDKPEDDQQLQVWYRKMSSLPPCGPDPPSPLGFLLKIQQLAGISYRRKDKASKMFLKVYGNIHDKALRAFCGQTYQSAALQLDQVREDLFELNDPVALYFFSAEEWSDRIAVKVEFAVFEVSLSKVQTWVYLGGVSVDPWNHPRGRVKETVKGISNDPVGSLVLGYTCTTSQAIKGLARLIPIHCLCGAEDTIPGLLGSHLPHGSGYLRIELTASYSLRLQLLFLEVPDSVQSECLRLAKCYFQSRSSAQLKEAKIEGQYLRICYHNGWRAVSVFDLELQPKKSLEVTNKNAIYRATQFQSEKLATLPTVFVEPNTVLCVELLFKVSAVVGEGGSQSVDYAVAGHFYLLEARDVVRKYRGSLSSGPRNSPTNPLPRLATSSTVLVEFDVQLQPNDDEQAPVSKAEFGNLDRLEMEKSRIIQDKKKIKLERRKLQMEYSDLPKVMDVAEVVEQTYLEKLMVIRRERDNNLERLQKLQGILQKYDVDVQTPPDPEGSRWESDDDDRPKLKGTQGVYYKTLLQPVQKSRPEADLPAVLIDEVPSAAIIRTELLESSYSSWFTFSFLTLQTESHKLPRKLTISMAFLGASGAQEGGGPAIEDAGPTFRTHALVTSLSTGELTHADQTGSPHPVYTLRQEPNQHHPRESLLTLLTYMLSNKVQLTIHDEFGIEFGSVLLPLDGLLRRRRQEVKVQFEAQVIKKDTVKGVLKVEIVNSRQQPEERPKSPPRVRSPGKDNLVAGDGLTHTRLQLVGEQRIKQRIENLKSRQQQASTVPMSSSRAPVPAGPSATQKLALMERLLNSKTATEKVICVHYMIPFYFLLEFTCPETSKPELYTISLIDPEEVHAAEFHLICSAQEAKKSLEESFLEGYDPLTLKNIDRDLTITLAKKEKMTMVWKYLSQRSARKSNIPGKSNMERMVCISVASNDTVLALYRVTVKPLPDIYHIQQTFYVGEGENTTLLLPPFCSPESSRLLQVEFTIPNLVLNWVQNNQLAVTLMAPQVSDLIPEVEFNMVVFEEEDRAGGRATPPHTPHSRSPSPTHTPASTPTPTETPRNMPRSSSRVISIWRIRVVSCRKVLVSAKLGVETETLVRLGKNVPKAPLVAVSEDEKVIKTTAPTMFPDGTCSFRIKVQPNFIGEKSFYLRVLDAKSNDSVQDFVVEVNSEQPAYKATFRVDHKKSVPRREQQFQYTNPLPKKAQFTLASTNPYLLRPENPLLEVAASKQKEFKLTLFTPASSTEYAEVTLSFTDKEQTVREFFLFKITYI